MRDAALPRLADLDKLQFEMAEREPIGAAGPRRRSFRDRRSSGRDRTSVLQALGRTARAAVGDLVIIALLLAGFFDGISGNPIHGILLGSVGLALAWDAGVARRRAEAFELGEPLGAPSGDGVTATSPAGAPVEPFDAAAGRVWTWVALMIAFVYAVLVGAFGRYSGPATVAVVIPGVAAVALAWRMRPSRPVPGKLEPGGVAAWLSVFVALGLWELATLLLQPTLTTDSYDHPTLSFLMDPVLATHPGRTIALLLWLAFGWFLLRR